jgi:F-type H+-transporting ATPase subunit delta
MQENLTIARPYAQAAFEVAQADGAVGDWDQSLSFLALVVNDADMRRVITDPAVSKGRLLELISAIAGDSLLPKVRNFVRVLLDAGRLQIAPEIATAFAAHRATLDNVAQVQVLTAFPLDAATESRIASAMQTRLGKAVRISQTIDSSLIGGAKVKVGDMVFDASLQGGLSQLANVFNIK